jgi:hypothetical protein
MLNIFAMKCEERTESFNDCVMSNFLADKEILRWENHFFVRKGNSRILIYQVKYSNDF